MKNNINNELSEMSSRANGRRRQRTIGAGEINDFVKLFSNLRDNPEVHTIRVYSRAGFVPNSYKYRADISYLEASRDSETGEWHYGANATDAKRSHGNGALITVNGRPYDN